MPNDALKTAHKLIWGPDLVRQDVFNRWCQGFQFSLEEPSCLLQITGGPCSVIAAVQTRILCNLLFERNILIGKASQEDSLKALISALINILQLVTNDDAADSVGQSRHCTIVVLDETELEAAARRTTGAQTETKLEKEQRIGPTLASSSATSDQDEESLHRHERSPISQVLAESDSDLISSCVTPHDDSNKTYFASSVSPDDSTNKVCVTSATEITLEKFLSCLDHQQISLDATDLLEASLMSLLAQFQSRYGILLLLYSVILSHSTALTLREISDETDRLVDQVHGHASQCLVNLLITGTATPHLFDGQRNLGGYLLHGVATRPQVGFLSLLEDLRLTEVGWRLKNPLQPVWILGSETHFSVLFSPNLAIIQQEKSGPLRSLETAFDAVDSEAKHFILVSQSDALLANASLTRMVETAYRQFNVTSRMALNELMVRQLDPEGLGILTRNDVLHFFFAKEMREHSQSESGQPSHFLVFHYNGLPQSNVQHAVRYRQGSAQILEPIALPSNPDALQNNPGQHRHYSSPIMKCLRTKWPTISIDWTEPENVAPSLN